MPSTTYYPSYPVSSRPPIATVINVAKATQVLALLELNKNKIFRGGSKMPDPNFFMLICMEAEILEWVYTYQPSYSGLEVIGNYVWALVGNFAGAAMRSLGNGSGIVLNPTTGQPINLIGYRSDFIVGVTGSLINQGDTSVTIPLPGFIRDTVHVFLSGIDLSIGITSQIAIYPSIIYDPAFIRIQFDQPAQNDQIYEISGLRATSGTITGGGGGSSLPIPTPLEQGKFLTNDGTQLGWSDVYFIVSSSMFETDGVTFLSASNPSTPNLANFNFDIRWENVPVRLEPGVDFIRITGGGFKILNTSFDATTSDNFLTVTLKGITS